MPSIGFLTGDLMFHSRVSHSLSGIEGNGTKVTLVVHRNIETLLEKLGDAQDVRLIIIDLALRDLDIETVSSSIKAKLPDVPIIAYGPHVAGAMLQAAVECGLDEVYTRGQFDHRMTEIILQFAKLTDSSASG